LLLVGFIRFSDLLDRPQLRHPKLCRVAFLSDRFSHLLAPLEVRGGRAATERKWRSMLVVRPKTNSIPASSLAAALEIHVRSLVHKGTYTPVPSIQHHMEISRTLRVGLGANSTLAPLVVSQKES